MSASDTAALKLTSGTSGSREALPPLGPQLHQLRKRKWLPGRIRRAILYPQAVSRPQNRNTPDRPMVELACSASTSRPRRRFAVQNVEKKGTMRRLALPSNNQARNRQEGDQLVALAIQATRCFAIEDDGEHLRARPFLYRKEALARLLLGCEACIILNEHIAEDGPTVFAHPASSALRASYRSG
jgi:hypothetical protein